MKSIIHRLRSFIKIPYYYIINHYEPFAEYLPNNTSPQIIGHTVTWTEITMYTYGTGVNHIVLQFGMHGNEVGTVKLWYKILEALDLWIIQVPSNLTIHIIPSLNKDWLHQALQDPDYQRGGMVGKVNANKVELSTNISTDQDFDTWFEVMISGKRYHAKPWDYPFSEPESQALYNTINKYKPIIIIDYHNAYPAIQWWLDTLSQDLSQHYRQLTWFKSREHLNNAPDVKRYESQWLSYIIVEWTNRYISDRKIHRHAIPKLFEFISHQLIKW